MKIRRKLFGITGGRVSKGNFGLIQKNANGTPKPKMFGNKIMTNRGKNSAGGRKPPRSNKTKPWKISPVPRKFNIDFEMMHRMVVSLNKKKDVKKAGKVASREEAEKVAGSSVGKEMTVVTEGSKTAVPSVIGQGLIVKNKNELTTGKPTPKSLKILEKIGGRITRVMWNTLLYGEPQSNYSQVERRQLRHEHGFNTKNWWIMPGCAAPGYLDVLDCILNSQNVTPRQAKITISGYVDGRTSSVADERKYASFLNFKVQMCFTNESNYLPVKLKLHFIVPKNDVRKQSDQDTGAVRAGYMYDFNNNVMNTFANYTQQKDNAIPVRYQLSGGDTLGIAEKVITDLQTGIKTPEGDNYRNTSIEYQVATKASPDMSPYFRDNYNICKTFSRTLDPNDVWNFSHTHYFGSGLELDELKSSFMEMNQNNQHETSSFLRVGNDRPLVGFWLVESVGVPCTCLVGDKEITGAEGEVFSNPYAGTSSGAYHCEIKSSMTYLAPLVNSTNAGTQGGTGGMAEAVHMRVYKKRDFNVQDSRMVRHVLPGDMVTDKDDLLLNKGMITVYTEAAVQTAGDKEYKA